MKKAPVTLPPAVWGLFPAALCLFAGLIDRLYIDIDTFLVSMTSAGLYGAGAVCPVIHPLLGIALSALSRIPISVDWFTFLSRVLVVAAVWWLGTLLAACLEQPAKRITCLLGLGFVLFRYSILNANYTVHCALFGAVGAATMLVALRRPLPRGAKFWAALFLGLSVLWRPEGAALLIPFVALDLCALALQHKLTGAAVRQVAVPCLAPALLLVVFSLLLGILVPGYAADKAYSDARRALVDYPCKPWAEVSAEVTALGLTENDYKVLNGTDLADTAIADTATLQKLALISKASRYPASAAGLLEALRSFPSAFTSEFSVILLLLALAAPCAVVVFGPTLLARLEALCAMGGTFLIAYYYLYAGRLPERLMLSILLVSFTVTLPLFLSLPAAKRPLQRRFWQAACLGMGGILCLFAWKNRHNYHIDQLSVAARPVQTVSEPAADDTVYLWDCMTHALYMTGEYMADGKLPDADFTQHNLPWGEWNTSGQTFYRQLLAKLDMQNPMQSLLTRPNTYLVAKDASLVETWLREHYDPHATMQQTGTINVYAYGEVPVWQAVVE